MTIPATIALIFPAGLEPTEVPIRTSPPSRPASPQDWARRTATLERHFVSRPQMAPRWIKWVWPGVAS